MTAVMTTLAQTPTPGKRTPKVKGKAMRHRLTVAELRRIAESCERTEELLRTLVNDVQGWLRRGYGRGEGGR